MFGSWFWSVYILLLLPCGHWWGFLYSSFGLCVSDISWSVSNLFLKVTVYLLLIWGSLNKFPDFFVWALLFRVHTWKSSPLRSNLLRLKCTCTAPTTSARPHRSPLVWACQRPLSQPLSSTHLSHNDSLWALGITKSHRDQGLHYREAEELSWYPSW